MAQSPDPEIELRQEDEDQIEICQGDIFVEENDLSHDSSDEISINENGGDEMEYEARHTARGPRNSRAKMKCRCIDRDCQTVAQAVEIIEAIMGDQERKSTVRGVFSHCDPGKNLNNVQTEFDEALKKSIILLYE
ncbi:hypothetical protein CHS0354_001348 [Potamilus streckersoni]|uniref:Uncharacterized protein n=1 Tax=Potamilus streckersoni TaxID=2493646 RepID=A0AAE0WBR6_9BIVA|nr:hypothetical protein CHS0354_001348 [Potamilus streckersoni]